MATTSSPNLTSASGVQGYLSRTPFASHAITPLTGGSGNFVYRAHLSSFFEAQSTVIVKHAQPYVKNLDTVPFGLDRQIFEVEALRRVHACLSADSLVAVPRIHLFDRQRNVIIMEDCGENTMTLKEYLRQREPNVSPELSDEIGTELGQFLGSFHQWGRRNPDGILDFFEKNKQAKDISAWAIYGRLLSTVNGDDAPLALSEPPIDVSTKDLEIVAQVASRMTDSIKSAHDVFVMGDFWPGNIMLSIDGGQLKRIYILDWELAKPGRPGVEIGQFCAEMYLLRRFNKPAKEAASRIISTFLHTYTSICGPDIAVGREAITQLGSHLVVVTPRVPWGNKTSTRAVVQEGLGLLVKASSQDNQWLRDSIVGPLIPR